jgi:hypothetical protein
MLKVKNHQLEALDDKIKESKGETADQQAERKIKAENQNSGQKKKKRTAMERFDDGDVILFCGMPKEEEKESRLKAEQQEKDTFIGVQKAIKVLFSILLDKDTSSEKRTETRINLAAIKRYNPKAFENNEWRKVEI